MLDKLKIPFVSKYRFIDCIDKKPLPFDFYLPKHKIIIEYQGYQHYVPYDKWGGQTMLDYTQRHDAIKREFCRKKRIQFEEIKYTDNVKDRLKVILSMPI
jgi:very-short-patch-repair endonuclease